MSVLDRVRDLLEHDPADCPDCGKNMRFCSGC
jgi:hypothetical protein